MPKGEAIYKEVWMDVKEYIGFNHAEAGIDVNIFNSPVIALFGVIS